MRKRLVISITFLASLHEWGMSCMVGQYCSMEDWVPAKPTDVFSPSTGLHSSRQHGRLVNTEEAFGSFSWNVCVITARMCLLQTSLTNKS